MSEGRLYHMAQCKNCPEDKGGHPRHFTDHEERAQWVGKHRLTTGHAVGMWLEVKQAGIVQ